MSAYPSAHGNLRRGASKAYVAMQMRFVHAARHWETRRRPLVGRSRIWESMVRALAWHKSLNLEHIGVAMAVVLEAQEALDLGTGHLGCE